MTTDDAQTLRRLLYQAATEARARATEAVAARFDDARVVVGVVEVEA